jgi:hypothetical protein
MDGQGAIGEKGNPNVELPPGPPFFHYADPAAAAAHLEAAGFSAGSCETTIVQQAWTLESADMLWSAMSGGTARTRATIAAQIPTAQKAIEQAMREACEERAATCVCLLHPLAACIARATQTGQRVEVPAAACDMCWLGLLSGVPLLVLTHVSSWCLRAVREAR